MSTAWPTLRSARDKADDGGVGRYSSLTGFSDGKLSWQWKEMVRTEGSFENIVAVPSPWWTSQSTIVTLSRKKYPKARPSGTQRGIRLGVSCGPFSRKKCAARNQKQNCQASMHEPSDIGSTASLQSQTPRRIGNRLRNSVFATLSRRTPTIIAGHCKVHVQVYRTN